MVIAVMYIYIMRKSFALHVIVLMYLYVITVGLVFVLCTSRRPPILFWYRQIRGVRIHYNTMPVVRNEIVIINVLCCCACYSECQSTYTRSFRIAASGKPEVYYSVHWNLFAM